MSGNIQHDVLLERDRLRGHRPLCEILFYSDISFKKVSIVGFSSMIEPLTF